MKTQYKRALLRAASVLVMLAVALSVIFVAWRRDIMAIVTTLSPMPYQYSDDEITSRVSASAAGGDICGAIADADKKYDVGEDFIRFLTADEHFDPDGQLTRSIERYLRSHGYRDEMWETLTGYTFSVLYDIYTGAADNGSVTVLGDIYSQRRTTLAFGGDVNLSADWYNMGHYREAGIDGCFSSDLLEMMRGADLMFVNNEFPVSTRGKPLSGKLYTFRADPADLSIYHDIGVDMVSLANNHIYDYGADAFEDTLTHLDDAGIIHIGAGLNEAEASRIHYVISGGMKIAFCAASSAEINRFTPVADGESGGVCGLYDVEPFCRVVEEAKANSDLVIAYVHFGTENSNMTNDEQVAAAHAIVDAGAGIVIGAHPHVLQPVEYYNGTPIVYSLGNFWFNTKTTDTALLTVSTSVGINPVVRFYPCVQSGGAVSLAGADDASRIIAQMNEWSSTADIGDDNRVRER